MKTKKSTGESLSFFSLFRYSSLTDKVLLCIGCVAAFLSGGVFPALNVAMGGLLDLFIQKTLNETNLNECIFSNATNSSSFNGLESSDEIFLEQFTEKCRMLCALVAVLGLTKVVLGYVMVVCLDTLAENQAFCVRDRFITAVLRQDIGWFDTNTLGDFSNKMTTELNKYQDGVGHKLAMFLSMNSTAIIGVVVSFLFDVRLTLVMLSATPLLIFAGTLTSKIFAKLSSGEMDAYSKAGVIAEEVLSSIRTVAAFGGEKKEIDRYKANLEDAKRSGIRKGIFAGVGQGLAFFMWYVTCALAFWYGSKRLLDSRCLASGFTAQSLFVVFFNMLLGSVLIGQSAPHASAISVAKVAAKSLFDVIQKEPRIDSSSAKGLRLRNMRGKIRFHDVTFNYPSRPDVTVLKNLCMEAMPGETVALVGASGSGKSTIMHLLLRFYDPEHGGVTIDGQGLRDLHVGWLRENIGVVGQEPDLFDTTIVENIRYGRKDAIYQEIENAAKEANAHDFIMNLPQKYNTLVGEKGAQLSAGQKQRLAIARALVKNPKILLLDEATSALDSESESVVQVALEKARIGRTTIVASHRLSTIRTADKIFVLEKGRVSESGTHQELLAAKGLYYRFWSSKKSESENSTRIQNIPSANGANFEDWKNFSRSCNGSISDDKTESYTKEPTGEVSKYRLLKMNSKEWPYLLLGLISSSLLGISLPLYGIIFGNVLSALSKERKEAESEMNFQCLLCLIFGVVVGLSVFFQYFMFSISGEKLTKRIRMQLFTKMISQEMAWYDKSENSTGSLCSQLSSDADSIQGATGSRLSTVLQSVFTLAAAIAVSLAFNVKIGLVVLSFIPLLLIGYYFDSHINSGQILSQKTAVERASKIATDAICNIRTVASLHLEAVIRDQYVEALTRPHIQAKRNAHISGIVFGLANAVPWFAQAAALYYGSVLISRGELFYGDLFKVTEGVLAGCWIIGSIVSFAPDYDKAKVAAVRIFKVFDRNSAADVFSPSGIKPVNPIEEILFSNVCFRYPTRREIQVLQNLQFKVKSGQTIALVGSSGCGKSTCVQLMERFYDSFSGNVKLDGSNIEDLNIAWLRSQIGLVPQEPSLFSYSIADNIAYGDNTRHVSMEEIVDAAQKANIHSFIQSLPSGYDTMVGAKGTQLSGGQKQRVAIARALVRNPQILILDEATSALDNQSEKVVQNALEKVRKGRTCISIAHRLSTVENADRIFVMNRGRIIEQGNHQELISLKGFYFKLYSKQTSAVTITS